MQETCPNILCLKDKVLHDVACIDPREFVVAVFDPSLSSAKHPPKHGTKSEIVFS